MKVLVTCILSLILLASCNHLEKGVVVEKEYEPARTYTVFIPMRVGKTTLIIPYFVYDNEDYILTVDGDFEGETLHEHVFVPKECFEKLSIGGEWIKTEDCTFSDENNTKERK